MTASRLHHLTVCVICCALCVVLQSHYAIDDRRYWVLVLIFAFASQPHINEVRALIAWLFPKRAPADPYALIRPIVK